jgi:hypothetical protein
MSAFQVVDDHGSLVLETDDWVAAETRALSRNWPSGRILHVRGTHPTHQWGPPHEGQRPPDPRCTRCGAWDNSSYGSHAPCGYDWSRDSLATALWRETRAREQRDGLTAAEA